MIAGALRRATDKTPLLHTVYRTTTALERMRGLLGRPPLDTGEAMLIDRCASVHTLGMRYPIDLAYLAGDGRVLKTVAGLRPLRLSACPRAEMTLEMRAGTLAELGLTSGDRMLWEPHAHA